MASHNYIIGFLSSTTNTLLTEPTPTIKHRRAIGTSFWSGKNWTLKSHDHESESYNKFKNFLLKLTQPSPWQTTSGHFFAMYANFVRYHFLWVSYLSISGGALVMCYVCKVPLFLNGIKSCHFC